MKAFESEFRKFEHALDEYHSAKTEKEFIYTVPKTDKTEEFALGIY